MHCNFGWDGSHDGYYYSYNFNTSLAPPYYSKGEELPEIDNIINEKSGTAGYYQYHLTMITGIRP